MTPEGEQHIMYKKPTEKIHNWLKFDWHIKVLNTLRDHTHIHTNIYI